MTADELELWRRNWITRLNLELSEAITGPGKNEPPEVVNLLAAMNYTLQSGGKRLRALLAIAAAEAVGGREEWALPGALAIEMIHAYSLIHDDLPALDNDDLRRGQPTCHLAYGEATAILAGDALQSLAFETLAAAPLEGVADAPQRIGLAILILAQAIGPRGMAGGQAMDLAFEAGAPNFDQVLTMEEKKTGALIGASLAVGAALGGADIMTLTKLAEVGRLTGLAFQITDDLLNVSGDPKLMGKNIGTDAQKSKASAAALLSPSEANEKVQSLIDKALPQIKNLGSQKLEWLISSIIGRSN
jgi:geranylgeranyl pyrophosphate synthase